MRARLVIYAFSETIGAFMLPGLEGFHRGTVPQRLLSDVMVIQALVVPRRFVQVLAGVEVPSPQQVGDTTVEAFDHAVGLGPLETDQAMLDPVLGTQPVEGVMPRRLALSGRGKAVGEFLAVVGHDVGHMERGCLQQLRQKAARRFGALGAPDLQVDPPAGPVNGHEQIPAGRLIRHLRQVLHVHVHKARHVVLERLVRGLFGLSVAFPLQGPQVAHTMPTQASVQSAPRQLRVQELPRHDQQVIQRQQRHFPHLHNDRLLLRRQGRVQRLRTMRPVFHVVAVAPLAHGHPGNAVAPGQLGVAHARRRLLQLPPDLGRRSRVRMNRTRHDVSPVLFRRTRYSATPAHKTGVLSRAVYNHPLPNS